MNVTPQEGGARSPALVSLPRLDKVPALLAWLLGGDAGRPLDEEGKEEALAQGAELLLDTRLAAEVSAQGPRLAAAGHAASQCRAFGIERARIRHVSELRAATVRRLSQALSGAQLSAMLYKGEAIVRLTHGDFSRRPMTDIDLVVAPEALARTTQVLEEAGFLPSHQTPMHDVLLDPASSGTGHPRGVAVEVHSDVMDPPHPFRLDLEGVLSRCTPSELPGLLLPRPADALFLHAFHLLFHEQDVRKGFLRLRDVALLARALEDREGEAGALKQLTELGEAAGLQTALAAIGARATAWAGAPGWLACLSAPRLRGRRGLALRSILKELDQGLVSAELSLNRSFSRRLAVALWQPRWKDSVLLILNGLGGKGSLGARLLRLPRLLGRYSRAAWQARS